MKTKSRKKKQTASKRHRIPNAKRAEIKKKVDIRLLDNSIAALLTWSQQTHGFAADVRRAVEDYQGAVMLAAGTHCISAMQKQRPILEELYVWKSEAANHLTKPDAGKMKSHLEEGQVLIEALFDILDGEFQLRIMHEPGETIPTPKRPGRNYKFQEKYRRGLATSRILFPGLRQGKTIVSPCEIAQIE